MSVEDTMAALARAGKLPRGTPQLRKLLAVACVRAREGTDVASMQEDDNNAQANTPAATQPAHDTQQPASRYSQRKIIQQQNKISV